MSVMHKQNHTHPHLCTLYRAWGHRASTHLLVDELTNDPEKQDSEEDSDDEIEDDSTEQEVLPHTKSYKEAIVGLEDIL